MIENIITWFLTCGVFGYLIKIEHRVSKIETYCKLKSGKCIDEN